MDPIAAAMTESQVTSIFSWMDKFAAYPQKSWIIAIVGAAVAAIIAELVLKLQYTKLTSIALRALGFLFLAYGLVLLYVRLRVHTVQVSSNAWSWMPPTGVLFLAATWALHKMRARTARSRTKRIADIVTDRIEVLEQAHGASYFVEQLTRSGEPVLPLLRSTVNRRKKGKKGNLIILTGSPESGKTASLLRFAKNCRASRPGRQNPLVPIYVDMEAYAAQYTETPSLPDFIQASFIRNDSPEADLEKAWATSGRYIDWIFLFDNVDEADLWQNNQGWSRQVIENLLDRHSRNNSFLAVMATAEGRKSAANPSIELGSLADDGWTDLLAHTGVGQKTTNAITTDEGLYWYVRDPGAANFLAPVLGERSWTTGENVHDALCEALKRRLNSIGQADATACLNSVLATGTATIKYLMSTSQGYYPDTPGNITKGLADIGKTITLPAQEVDSNLVTLARHGIIKRIKGRQSDHVKFSSVAAAYFYSCALRDSPDEISVEELLCEERLRLAAVSFLQTADSEYINRVLTKMDSIVDSAVEALNKDQLDLLNEQIDLAKRANRPPSVKRAESMLADRYTRGQKATTALLVLVAGLQNRPELRNEEMREKFINFAELVMPHCDPRTQAHVFAVRYALDTSRNTPTITDPGLDSRDSQTVLDTASRIVNTVGETAGLTDEFRNKLVDVIIIVGLRSLALSRGRSNLPATFVLANDAGTAIVVLYGIIFGLGGLLQLGGNWRSPGLQVCEIIIAVIVTVPLIASRYFGRHSFLSFNFHAAMRFTSISLALIGALWAAIDILIDLATFTMPIMPLLACYSLMWPAYVGFYLTHEPNPSATHLIFPSPQIAGIIWRTQIVKFIRYLLG